MEDNLTIVEQKLEKEFRENYIRNYCKLVADNISSIYKYFSNNHNWQLLMAYKVSQDTLNFSQEENLYVNSLVDEILKTKHNLKLISKNMNEKLQVETIK